MLVLDQIEFPVLFWGALKAGVIAVPLNTLLAGPVYDAILRDSRATTLVVSDALFEVVEPVLTDNPFLERVIVIGADARKKHNLIFIFSLKRVNVRISSYGRVMRYRQPFANNVSCKLHPLFNRRMSPAPFAWQFSISEHPVPYNQISM